MLPVIVCEPAVIGGHQVQIHIFSPPCQSAASAADVRRAARAVNGTPYARAAAPAAS
jgi:hypothetical protein